MVRLYPRSIAWIPSFRYTRIDVSVGVQDTPVGETSTALAPVSGGELWAHRRRPKGLIQRLAHGIDGFVVSQLPKLAPNDVADVQRLLEDQRAFGRTSDYRRYANQPNIVFPPPPRTRIGKRWLAPHRVGFTEWRWHSEHPFIFRDIEEEYRSRVENQAAILRLLKLRVKGAPVAILVNGFSSGHHLIERAAWPMWEFHRMGIGVALFALPFHGPRGRGFPPEWPHRNTAFTIEGFRQAIWDLRIAIDALRAAGASHVGVVGMSLGGYTSALLATVTAELDFVISYIPVASIPDVLHDIHIVPGESVERDLLYEGYKKQLEPITPVNRKPLVAPERIRVISGEFDRLATMEHGARLSAHFDAPQLTFPGAHLIQTRRSRAFRRALSELRRNGAIPRRRGPFRR